MRTGKILAPKLACGLISSVFGATVILGCSDAQDLGTRPTDDASPGDSSVLYDGSVSTPDAGPTPEAAAPDTGVAADASAPHGDGGPHIVLFGGTDGENPFGDTWTFDGTEWTPINISGPPARTGMVAATLGGNAVIFGGENSNVAADGGDELYNDTWSFDGTTWTELSTPTAPSPRGGSGAAVINGAMYIFGGGDASSSYLTDTWKFDGTTWTQVSASGPTPTRDGFAMGPLVGGNKALFFGGDTSTGDFQNDTWTFDGTSWTPVTTATSPSARALALIVPWNGGALQWGGNTAVGPNDTWTFDGTNWTVLNVTPPGGATDGPCGASAAVLDSKVVLFGGYCSAPSDTTYVFDGTSWSLLDLSSHPFVPGPRVGAAMTTIP